MAVAENGEADEWQPFSIGKLSYVDANPPARENLKSIIERCNRKEIVIWQEMLGIDGISVHDNFFELGGESVKAIQISVKINEAGLQFTPQQLFQSQTIAELAAILDPSQAQELAMAAAAGANAGDTTVGSDQPFAGLSA